MIVASDTSHTTLQSLHFCSQDANGVLLDEWTQDFLRQDSGWIDIVEDAIPSPQKTAAGLHDVPHGDRAGRW